MITNNQNQVAVAYYQTIPHVVRVGQNQYAFTVKANICMAWVKSEDVGSLLQITKQCCGGNKKTVYRYANESDVRRWDGISER